MAALTRPFRRRLLRRGRGDAAAGVEAERPAQPGAPPEQAPVEIAPNDPLLAYFQAASEAVEIYTLELDSPALRELKAAGVKLAVPLVSQGGLMGLWNLGPRLSEQEYSADDRKLLDNLAAQAAPALRVGQLVREQEAGAATRQRFEQELEVARLIQQNFLPKQLPELQGWQIAAYYRPAREVGGDFYDVIPLPDGRVGFVVGDVTDKGVPAALVMSATRSVLRASATRLIEPGVAYEEKEAVLEPGDSVLLHSDGVVEAHDPDRDMFGFPRLKETMAGSPGGQELIDRVIAVLEAFTGPGAEQEDDITMVTLQRSADSVKVQVTDLGGVTELPDRETPDLEAKLAGRQKPRGWGLFLIEQMVDEARVTGDEGRRTLELVVRLRGGDDGDA